MESLVYILVSLLFSAFFSGMEIAYVSSSKLRYELDKADRSLSSRILGLFYRNPSQFITTMLVGNNIALVVYGLQMAMLLEPYIARFVQSEALIVFLQSVISTLLILVTGEFVPKMIFKINPNFSLKLFAFPLFVIYVVLYPLSTFASLLSYVILKIAGVKSLKNPAGRALGKIDLDYFIQQSIDDDAPQSSGIDKNEVKIFRNALDFSNVRLRDCIVPRTEIVACDTGTTVGELRSKFIETGLSKIIVYRENIDDIIGYIHSSELFSGPDGWTDRIRPVPIVPETMAANKLMKVLMGNKKSMAVVVDEFGGTAGIVTLEDLVEEIFGEIEDEHDVKSYVARKVNENEYVLSGRMEIDLLNEKFDLDLPESDDYVTVAGFILYHLEKFPKANETVDIGRFSFKILKMTSTKIELVRLKVSER